MAGEGSHLTAAFIAVKLRAAGIGCEIVNLVPTETAVLRRDRIVVCLALIFLTALAWSYLLWLSADMAMGGMDMGRFRMIPSGMSPMRLPPVSRRTFGMPDSVARLSIWSLPTHPYSGGTA